MSERQPMEADVEAYLRDEVRTRGWDIRKYINDPRRGGTPGTPDDIVSLPGGFVAWVEVKHPKKVDIYRARRLRFYADGDTTGCSRSDVRQFQEQERLENLEHFVSIVGNYEEVDLLLKWLENIRG